MTLKHWAALGIGLAVAVGVLIGIWPRRVVPVEFESKLVVPEGRLAAVRISPNDRHVLVGAAEGRVYVGDFTTGVTRELEPRSTTAVMSLVFSPDDLLLAASRHGELRAWSYPELKPTPIESPQAPVTAFAFRKTSTAISLLLGLADGRVAILTEGKLSFLKTAHRGIKAMTLTADGQVLISAGTEGKLVWYDLQQESVLATKADHRTELAHLCWSPDHKLLASGDWNGHLRIWNAATRETVATNDQPDAVSGMAWRGTRLFTGSWDGYLRVWSVESATLRLASSINVDRPIHALDVDQAGTFAATVSATSEIERWKLP